MVCLISYTNNEQDKRQVLLIFNHRFSILQQNTFTTHQLTRGARCLSFPTNFSICHQDKTKALKTEFMVSFFKQLFRRFIYFFAVATFGGLIRVGPENLVLPAGFAKIAKNIYNFAPREDDVWVFGYPRTGNNKESGLRAILT